MIPINGVTILLCLNCCRCLSGRLPGWPLFIPPLLDSVLTLLSIHSLSSQLDLSHYADCCSQIQTQLLNCSDVFSSYFERPASSHRQNSLDSLFYVLFFNVPITVIQSRGDRTPDASRSPLETRISVLAEAGLIIDR